MSQTITRSGNNSNVNMDLDTIAEKVVEKLLSCDKFMESLSNITKVQKVCSGYRAKSNSFRK